MESTHHNDKDKSRNDSEDDSVDGHDTPSNDSDLSDSEGEREEQEDSDCAESSTDTESEDEKVRGATSCPITSSLVNEAYEKHRDEEQDMLSDLLQEGRSQSNARRIVRRRLLPVYRRSFRSRFGKFVIKCEKLRKEPLYKAVMRTAKALKDHQDYCQGEAVKYALTKRKFLLDEEFQSEDDEIDSDDSEL